MVSHGSQTKGRGLVGMMQNNKNDTGKPILGRKHGEGKPVISKVPTRIIYEMEKVLSYGFNKYENIENWRHVEPDLFKESLLRHILKIWENGIDAVDPESGMLHLSHAACNIAFILELMDKPEIVTTDSLSRLWKQEEK